MPHRPLLHHKSCSCLKTASLPAAPHKWCWRSLTGPFVRRPGDTRRECEHWPGNCTQCTNDCPVKAWENGRPSFSLSVSPGAKRACFGGLNLTSNNGGFIGCFMRFPVCTSIVLMQEKWRPFLCEIRVHRQYLFSLADFFLLLKHVVHYMCISYLYIWSGRSHHGMSHGMWTAAKLWVRDLAVAILD